MPTVRRVRRTSADERSRDEEEERPRRRRREEEEDEERPARRSRARDEEEEDERPARRRRAARDDEEDEENDRPARGRRRSRDDEEDEEDHPRRRGGLGRGRASRDDEDDDKPRGRRGKPSNVVRRGWAGYDETRAETSGYGERLDIEREPKLVKFLEDEPYASFGQHWVDNPPAPFKKKSWICIKKDCPLCDLGDRPRSITYFNVLLMSSGGEPEVRSLEIGRTAADSLKALHDDSKTGPLTKHYFAIRKSGKQQTSNILFSPVKERDFEDDWRDIDPLTEEEFEEYQELCFTEDNIQLPSRKTLEEIADALAED